MEAEPWEGGEGNCVPSMTFCFDLNIEMNIVMVKLGLTAFKT